MCLHIAVSLLLEMMNIIPFKFYLRINNGQEIRRFALNPDEVGELTYLVLKNKVQVLYPQLLFANFNLCYIGKQKSFCCWAVFKFIIWNCCLINSVFFFSIDEEGDKVTISSDDELESAFVFVKRKDGEPFCFIIQTNCGPASKITTGNCKDCCNVTCNKPPAVLVKPDVNQHCPYKLFMERAKETLNIRPEYLKGLSSIIPSVMEGLGKSNRFYSIVPL